MANDIEEQAIENDEVDVSNDDTGDSGSGFLSGLNDALTAKPAANEDDETGDRELPTEVVENEQQKPDADTEPAVDPDLEDMPNKEKASKASKEGWKAIKESKRATEEERDKLKAELEQLKTQPATQQNSEEIIKAKQELDQVRQKLQDYEQKIAVYDVTQTNEYRENIGIPLENAQQLVGQYASAYELDQNEVARITLIENPIERNKALSELTSAMNEYDKLEFKRVLDDTKTLFLRSLQVRENAAENLKYVEQQRKAEEDAKKSKWRETLHGETDKIWGDFTKEVPFITEDKATSDKLLSDAKSFDFDSASPDQRAFAAIAVATLPSIKQRLNAMAKELETYKAAAAKRTTAGTGIATGSAPEVSTKKETFEEGLRKLRF